MKITLTVLTALATAGILQLAGCATTPPPELVQARDTYQRAAQGAAKDLAPAQLHTAQQALQRAEKAFADEPEADETRDWAYLAHREAMLAEAKAAFEVARRTHAKAKKDLELAQVERQRKTEQQLDTTRDQLSSLERQRALDAQRDAFEQQKAAKTEAELEAAKAAQAEAEAQLKAAEESAARAEAEANAALDELKKIAEVREEKRGMVIALSGSVLFASGRWDLLPAAKSRLQEVANFLKTDQNRKFVVEGHTDAQGSDRLNEELSRKRAEAVRNHLISHGVPPDRIQAVGLGEKQPIADNTSPEGRANNRRVEIVLEDPAA